MAIYNIGSINIDHLYSVERLPEPGETLSSTGYQVNMGGKGLNISVAASRAGAEVRHVGLVGRGETYSRKMIAEFGLDDGLVTDVDASTGHAIIYLDDQSENCIVIHGGANRCFSEAMIRDALSDARSTDWLILQNETNANEAALRVAHEKGMKIALVAAPFDTETMPHLIKQVDLVSMNETESELFEAAVGKSLKDLDGPEFLITYGKRGAMFFSSTQQEHVNSYKVKAVDTTGAGDTFFGVFMAGYANGNSVNTAIRNANAAGALMVQRKGAASVVPTRTEIEAFLDETHS